MSFTDSHDVDVSLAHFPRCLGNIATTLYNVLTFQLPILIACFGWTNDLVIPGASGWLWPLRVIQSLSRDAATVFPSEFALLLVSVISYFLWERVINPLPNPQPKGPGDHSSSRPYLSTCPAWVTLPGA